MRKLIRVSPSFAIRAIDDPIWDAANRVLYDLCRRHPDHTDEAIIVAKVWLIGRSYAAAIERGAISKYLGDKLYTKGVSRILKRRSLDNTLKRVHALRRSDAETVVSALEAINKVFGQISGRNNRSLVSKYMHFHCPKSVYIYDSRAVRAIRLLTKRARLSKTMKSLRSPYASFFLRCEDFRITLEKMLHRKVTPRDLDKVLLAVVQKLS